MATTTTDATTTLRRCIGSTRFGIDAHEAPADDFPAQPSQKDGLGRMCKPHWRAYTNALRKAAVARKAADEPTPTEAPVAGDTEPAVEVETPVAETEVKAPRRGRRAKADPDPEAEDAAASPRFATPRAPGESSGASLRPMASVLDPRDIGALCRPVAPQGRSGAGPIAGSRERWPLQTYPTGMALRRATSRGSPSCLVPMRLVTYP
jgi:hypothetical protein